MYPRLTIDLKKIEENTRYLADKCKSNGLSTMAVTKVYCAFKEVAEASLRGGAEYLADSRLENLNLLRDLDVPKVLLRLPMQSEAKRVVELADISLNSEIETIKALNQAAQEQGKTHKVLLMIDLGDLREGILKKDVEYYVKSILDLSNIELFGIGVNLTCYGGVIPSAVNLGELTDIAASIEEQFDIKLNMISGGNSSSLYLLDREGLPSRINNLRLGEAVVLGRETAYGDRIDGTHDDCFTLEAEIIELKEKNSVPTGEIGMDAFGNKPEFEDRGMMVRCILAVGQQDVEKGGLIPTLEGVDIIGASSDHLIADVTHVKSDLKVGDTLTFKMEYGALLKACTSHYINKIFI